MITLFRKLLATTAKIIDITSEDVIWRHVDFSVHVLKAGATAGSSWSSS